MNQWRETFITAIKGKVTILTGAFSFKKEITVIKFLMFNAKSVNISAPNSRENLIWIMNPGNGVNQ